MSEIINKYLSKVTIEPEFKLVSNGDVIRITQAPLKLDTPQDDVLALLIHDCIYTRFNRDTLTAYIDEEDTTRTVLRKAVSFIGDFFVQHSGQRSPQKTATFHWLVNAPRQSTDGLLLLYKYICYVRSLTKDDFDKHSANALAVLELLRRKCDD